MQMRTTVCTPHGNADRGQLHLEYRVIRLDVHTASLPEVSIAPLPRAAHVYAHGGCGTATKLGRAVWLVPADIGGFMCSCWHVGWC